MELVFVRFLEVLDTWLETGKLPKDEFRVRGVSNPTSTVIVALALLAFAFWFGLCAYLVIAQT